MQARTLQFSPRAPAIQEMQNTVYRLQFKKFGRWSIFEKPLLLEYARYPSRKITKWDLLLEAVATRKFVRQLIRV